MENNKISELNQKKNFLGKLSELLIDRYRVVYLLIVSIIIMGLYSYVTLPKESVPDISMNSFLVTTVYSGASVEDVESLVTNPIEDVLDGLDDVDEITSDSTMGVSSVKVRFIEGADLDQAEIELSKDLNNMNLPDGAMDPIYIRFESGEMPIMSMTLTGDYDLTELKEYGEVLENKFETVPGVKSISLTGGYEREIRVTVDFNSMAEYGVNISSVQNALQASNINMPAGSKVLDGEEFNIRVDESFKSIEDIKNLVIRSSQNGTIFLKDIATIEDSYKDPTKKSRTYVRGESIVEKPTPAVYISVFRESGYDIIMPVTEIRGLIDESVGTVIPEDVVALITSDMSQDVSRDLNTVISNALSGLLTVIAVLFIFIGLNESLIVAMVIPLSLFISFGVMTLTGMTFNSISLLGYIIALGLLVDNAIVVMENVDRLREMGVDRVTASKVGSNQVGPAILAASLTTMGAFLPIALMPGMIGKFLGIMPKAVMYTIGASLVVSVFITPALCARFLPKYKADKKGKLPLWLKNVMSVVFVMTLSLYAFSDSGRISSVAIAVSILFGLLMILKEYLVKRGKENPDKDSFVEKYKKFVYNILKSWKKTVLVMVIAILVFVAAMSSVVTGKLALELFPVEEPNSFKLEIALPIGSLMADTEKIVEEVETYIMTFKDLESFSTTIGKGTSTSPIDLGGSSKHLATIDMELVDQELREVNGNDILVILRDYSKTVPGADITVSGLSVMGPPTSGSDIEVSLKGDDLEVVNQYADMYLEILRETEGVQEVSISTSDGLKEVNIDIDNNRAAYYGMNISSISQEIRHRVSGVKVGVYKEDGEEYDVSVYYPQNQLKSVYDLENMHFPSNNGTMIPFSEIASIEIEEGMSGVSHDGGSRVVKISASVKPDLNVATVSQAYENELKNIKLPSTIERVTQGQAKDLNEQVSSMITSFSVAILLVYIVLVVQFNSLLQPIVILFSVPFALIGVIFGLIITGNNLGMYAMMGTVALVGIAVNDAIVLIDYTNYLRSIGKERIVAVSEAVKTRFIPVIATSLTTIGGVLPLAIYNETFSQLGYAIIFGLLASTVLTLLIVPIIYTGLDGIAEKMSKRTGFMID